MTTKFVPIEDLVDLQLRADKAEATIARVEALPEKWRGDGDPKRRTIFASVCIDDLEAVLKEDA